MDQFNANTQRSDRPNVEGWKGNAECCKGCGHGKTVGLYHGKNIGYFKRSTKIGSLVQMGIVLVAQSRVNKMLSGIFLCGFCARPEYQSGLIGEYNQELRESKR